MTTKITRKQQAIIVIALSHLARMASEKLAMMPSLEDLTKIRTALDSVMNAAQILTDEEMISLAASTCESILKIPVSDAKITPDPSNIPMQ